MDARMRELLRLAQAGRRAEKRGAALRGCLTSLLTGVLYDLAGGWLFMLAVGIAAEHWWPAVPTIGYWWAVLLVAFLRRAFMRGAAEAAKR